jgi:hypothetical protein
MTGGDKRTGLALLTVTLPSMFATDGSGPFVFIAGTFCACASMKAARKTAPNETPPVDFKKAAEMTNGILAFIVYCKIRQIALAAIRQYEPHSLFCIAQMTLLLADTARIT